MVLHGSNYSVRCKIPGIFQVKLLWVGFVFGTSVESNIYPVFFFVKLMAISMFFNKFKVFSSF
jgi:hypothetical protein